MWVKVVAAWVLAGLAVVAGSASSGGSSMESWSPLASQIRLSNLYSIPAAQQLLREAAAEEEELRMKRGRSLSVSNPIDVLRNKWRLDMARRQVEKAAQNREYLKTIGKRHTQFNRLLDTLEHEQERDPSSDYQLSNNLVGGDWGTS